jgi:hypothetical protein
MAAFPWPINKMSANNTAWIIRGTEAAAISGP